MDCFLVGSYVVTFCGDQLDEEGDSPLLWVLVLTCRCTIHLLDSQCNVYHIHLGKVMMVTIGIHVSMKIEMWLSFIYRYM